MSLSARDEQTLATFGYKQELSRTLRSWHNFAMGFAYISPIVGLYTVVVLMIPLAGPAWVWAVPTVVAGQLLVAFVFAELGSKWPLAGAIYQWSRRLGGAKYGWWTGWLYIWANIATISVVAYAGGGFLGELFGLNASSKAIALSLAGAMLVVIVVVNAVGLHILKYLVNIGVTAELLATLVIGILLLAFHRVNSPSVLIHTLGAVHNGGSFLPVFIAALAFGGWIFFGFDTCGAVAEETTDATRSVPRTTILSLLAVGSVGILASFALTLAEPNLKGAVAGLVSDPVAAPVKAAFGTGVVTPFLVLVVLGFLSCGVAVQATTVRAVYSMARDDLMPFSSQLRRVSHVNHIPVIAVIVTGVLSGVIFLYGQVLSVLVAFATGGIYLAYLAPTAGAVWSRIRRKWTAGRGFDMRTAGALVVTLAAIWLGFEFINIAWPRSPSLAWYLNWAVPVVTGFLAVLGIGLFYRKRRLIQSLGTTAAQLSGTVEASSDSP
jgi:amino acid transporter